MSLTMEMNSECIHGRILLVLLFSLNLALGQSHKVLYILFYIFNN